MHNNTLARAKTMAGTGDPIMTATVAASFVIQLDSATTEIELSSSGDVTSADTFLVCPVKVPGRRLLLINADGADSITLAANTVAAAVEGQLVCGGDLVLAPNESVVLMQRTNGSWIKA